MFSTGNMNPVSKMVGSIMPIREIIMADCCVSALIDINKPTDREVRINRILSNISKIRLPLISRSKNVTLSIRMMPKFIMEISR